LTQKRTKKSQGKKKLPRSCLHTTPPFCLANALVTLRVTLSLQRKFVWDQIVSHIVSLAIVGLLDQQEMMLKKVSRLTASCGSFQRSDDLFTNAGSRPVCRQRQARVL